MKRAMTFAVLASTPLLASAVDYYPMPVPEPSVLSMMLMGMAMIGAIKLRNKFRK